MTPSNAISGFQATGVFPLNRRAITIPGLEEDEEDVSMDDCALQAGVSYVPLFSPAPKKDSSRKSVQFSDEEIIEFENQLGQELSSHSFHSDDDFHICDVSLVSESNELSQFSEEERKKFTRLFENGYDLPFDDRYKCWLKTHHPDVTSSVDDDGKAVIQRDEFNIKDFLELPQFPSKHKSSCGKGTARVLTSEQTLMRIAERERQKQVIIFTLID